MKHFHKAKRPFSKPCCYMKRNKNESGSKGLPAFIVLLKGTGTEENLLQGTSGCN